MSEYLAFLGRFITVLIALLIFFSIMGAVAIGLILSWVWFTTITLNIDPGNSMVIALFLMLVFVAAMIAKEG